MSSEILNPFFIVNPESGGGRGRKLIAELSDLHSSEIAFHDVSSGPLASKLERIKEAGAVLVAGGDGTVSQIVSELSEYDLTIGVIPFGTGNDLARSLGVFKKFDSTDLRQILDFYSHCKIAKLRTWVMHYGENFQNYILFCNYASFGFDGEVISKFDRVRKSSLYFADIFGRYGNRAAYVAVTMSRILRSPKFDLRISTTQGRKENSTRIGLRTVMLANIQQVMGLGRSNFISDPGDDELELLTLKSYAQYLPFAFNRKVWRLVPEVLGRAAEWELSFSRQVSGQIDGEPFNDFGSAVRISKGHAQKFLMG